MASFSAGTTFTDGVANDVTAAKLAALVNNATPTSGLIQDRTAETVTATNDTLLIGDASDSNNLKRITVANFAQTLPTAKVTTGTIDTATLGTTTGTAATFTTGTITTLTAGTTTSTAATITTGTITTGVIPTLTSTTLITSGTGTAASPAIVPTGDTNTGIFFPAADTIAFSEGGTESMRINSSGNVGIGTTSPAGKFDVVGGRSFFSAASEQYGIGVKYVSTGGPVYFGAASSSATPDAVISGAGGGALMTLQDGGNVGIGTTSPTDAKLSVHANNLTIPAIAARYSAAGYKMGFGVYNVFGYPYLGFNCNQVTSSDNQTYDLSAHATKLDMSIDVSTPGFVFSTAASGTAGSAITWSERLRIDSSGNVGIGTTSPSKKLQVDGNCQFGTTGSSGTVLRFEQDAGNGIAIRSERSDTSGARYLAFGTDYNERLRIDSSGFVSIGTATALSALHVHGNVTLSNTTTATSAGTGGLSKPATYAGYLTVSINGTSRKIPYYAT